MYGNTKVTFEEAIEIFKSRIADLRPFEEYSFEDIKRITDSRTRARAEMSKKTLELNKIILNSNMECVSGKMS